MTPHIRRRLAAAVRRHRDATACLTAVITLPAWATANAPHWMPGSGYLEAWTATVYAKPLRDGLAHAVVLTDGDSGVRMRSGIVRAADVARWGGLCDKPWRISWLAQTPLGDQILDAAHPAAGYRRWIHQLTETLAERHRHAATARRVHPGQLRLSATPSGRFQATIDIDIESGRASGRDLDGHAAALAALLRQFQPGVRLRFHPSTASHVTEPLYHHAHHRLRSR